MRLAGIERRVDDRQGAGCTHLRGLGDIVDTAQPEGMPENRPRWASLRERQP